MSIARLVGAPPERLQESVEDPPEAMEEGEAVKELITGAVTTGGWAVTVTVADRLTVPALFEAVRV